MSEGSLAYKRSRFGTRLPAGRRYTGSHFWLLEEEAGLWRIGFTKFASRMLGDMVEYEFSVKAGAAVEVGQAIGWIEGFKAVSELYSVARGDFLGPNPALEADITLADNDPYEKGWLYRVRGAPDPKAVDVHGYIAVLDATIDKMMEDRHSKEDSDG